MARFVIYHEANGIYLGSSMGLGFWSKLDPVGQDHAVTFETREEALLHLASWEGTLTGCLIKPVSVEGEYAPIEACVQAGLPRWDPDAPPTIPDETLN